MTVQLDPALRMITALWEQKGCKLARLVMSLHDNGSTGDEIAAVTGRSASAVRRFAAKHGALVTRSCAVVRFAIPISLDGRDALRRLASDHGATCAESVGRLVDVLPGAGRGGCAADAAPPRSALKGEKVGTL